MDTDDEVTVFDDKSPKKRGDYIYKGRNWGKKNEAKFINALQSGRITERPPKHRAPKGGQKAKPDKKTKPNKKTKPKTPKDKDKPALGALKGSRIGEIARKEPASQARKEPASQARKAPIKLPTTSKRGNRKGGDELKTMKFSTKKLQSRRQGKNRIKFKPGSKYMKSANLIINLIITLAKALREIRRYQKEVGLLVPKMPF